MFTRGLIAGSFVRNKLFQLSHYRNIQVSVIGAANQIGSNLAVILMQNPKITRLNLYDDDEKVKGIGLELSYINRGTQVSAYAGENFLPSALRSSSLILMVSRTARNPGTPRDKMLAANAPAVQRLCRAIADQNKDAFFAISTNPINSILPFASSLMFSYGTYNPSKICGITHIDTARCRNFVANALKVNPNYIHIPVIGGHSEETIIPLFSNLTPSSISIEPCKVDTLTRLLRKAGTEVLNQKHGKDSSVLCMAWSIAEFTDRMLNAICGYESVVNCFSANPYFGTRFFAGPALVGPRGIIRVCGNMPMSEYETTLLNNSIPTLNKEVCFGENYIHVMDSVGKRV
jgi:malate dehydrogenase